MMWNYVIDEILRKDLKKTRVKKRKKKELGKKNITMRKHISALLRGRVRPTTAPCAHKKG